MINIVAIFFITLIISYIATIPPGPLSLFVTHTALSKNLKQAVIVGIGGAICEMIYAFLATYSIAFFDQNPIVKYWMTRLIIIILIVMGVSTFIQKNTDTEKQNFSANSNLFAFFKGVSLSLFNPALFAFWVVVLVGYQKYPFLSLDGKADKIAFFLGAGFGTFLLTFTYASIGIWKRENVFKYLDTNKLNKITGLIFIGLAIMQIVELF